MAINIFFVIYILGLLVFIFGALAVVYHIQAYKLNEKISTMTTMVFVVGAIILIAFNLVSAIKVDWGSFPSIIFS